MIAPSLSERVRRWRDAWQSGDPEAVAALYHPDGVHESAKVAATLPDLGRTLLRGPTEIGDYARRALVRVGRLRFDITAVIETPEASVVEYERTATHDLTPRRVAEILRWRGDRLTACRVYHF